MDMCGCLPNVVADVDLLFDALGPKPNSSPSTRRGSTLVAAQQP